MNGVDFDDFFVQLIKLFEQNKSIHKKISSDIHYLLVDEFQDTSSMQYKFAKALVAEHKRLFVVGDPNQNIFSFRFANKKNIDILKTDFPEAQEIHLVQNYRSTQTILRVAAKLLESQDNSVSLLKSISGEGEPVKYYEFLTEREQLQFISSRIMQLVSSRVCDFSNIAVLCTKDVTLTFPIHSLADRVNFMSKSVEEWFKTCKIPFHVHGSAPFYEKTELQPLLACLRVLNAQQDSKEIEAMVRYDLCTHFVLFT